MTTTRITSTARKETRHHHILEVDDAPPMPLPTGNARGLPALRQLKLGASFTPNALDVIWQLSHDVWAITWIRVSGAAVAGLYPAAVFGESDPMPEWVREAIDNTRPIEPPAPVEDDLMVISLDLPDFQVARPVLHCQWSACAFHRNVENFTPEGIAALANEHRANPTHGKHCPTDQTRTARQAQED